MAKLVDALALGASEATHEGSSPFPGTMIHIPVIFEDAKVIVINKPSGMVVHPFDFSSEETVLDFLQAHAPEIFSIHNQITLQDGRVIPRGGVVHKLDRETSGVMVIAKTQELFSELKAQFSLHTVEKAYVAVIEGIVKDMSFVIDAPLGRGKKDYKQSTNPVNPRGELREAITQVDVLSYLGENTFVQLTPRTGRTHQLRAHMSSIGHPIVGDIAYGSKAVDSRIMLHAQSIRLDIVGEKKVFSAPLPEGFQD